MFLVFRIFKQIRQDVPKYFAQPAGGPSLQLWSIFPHWRNGEEMFH